MKKSAKPTTKVKIKDLKPKKSASIKAGMRARVAEKIADK